MRLQFLLGEIWTGLRRNLSIAVSVLLVTTVSLYLLGLGLLAQREVDTLKGYWYDRIQVSIFLCSQDSGEPNCAGKAVTDQQRTALKEQLEQMKPLVENVYYESEQQAYDRFQDQFRNSPLASNIRVGDIPQSYRVQLSDPTKYDVVVSAFEGAPGVGRVQDQQKTLDKLFKVMNGITIASLGLAFIMLVCAVLLMVTTIRQAAFTRRRETGIMKLVGASNLTIRLPFVMEIVLATLAGVAASVGLLWATMHFLVVPYVAKSLPDVALVGVSDVWVIAPYLAVLMLGIAVVTSWATLWRYLRV
ncbi:MAG TPA: permease-like cell division protein FtsX [Pedococcus sp.]|jgi:cell division transport system permease protein